MAKIILGIDEKLIVESGGEKIEVSSRAGVLNIQIGGRWLSLADGKPIEHTHYIEIDSEGKNIPIINEKPIERR